MIDKNDQRLVNVEKEVKTLGGKVDRLTEGYFKLNDKMDKMSDDLNKKIDDKLERILIMLDRSAGETEIHKSEQPAIIFGAERMQDDIKKHDKRITKLEKVIKPA
ncbi:MAG: hypothetical protein NTW79_00940 [Candidatus Berkelbacteria bacterium]|nr:hypothetical protein [Candidatus Berkelbacteria bacterium]